MAANKRGLALVAMMLLGACATASSYPVDGWYQVTAMTQALSRGPVFPFPVSRLDSLFSRAEARRIRTAPQAQGNERIHNDLTWSDVDGHCHAYFMTDDTEEEIEDLWLTCSSPSEQKALDDLRAWLSPFRIELPAGATEAEGTVSGARVIAGVYRGSHDSWDAKIQFMRGAV